MNESGEPRNIERPNTVREKHEATPEMKAKGKQEYENRVIDLTTRAIRQHLQAVSYRAFRVGSSLIADNPRVAGGYETRSAHNYKPWENPEYGWDKLCAESNASSDSIVHGAEYISGIIIASHHKEIGSQPEDATHSEAALHSCKNCRQLFRELIDQGIMSEDTMIRFVDDGPLIYEDKDDLEEFIIDTGPEAEPLKIQWPRLKLKKEITEQDVASLPFEEMTMGKFLNLPIYKKDGPPQTGKSAPPYTVVMGK